MYQLQKIDFINDKTVKITGKMNHLIHLYSQPIFELVQQ